MAPQVDIKKKKRKKKPSTITAKDLALRKKWQARIDDTRKRATTGHVHLAVLDGLMGSEAPIKDAPDVIRCSFCGHVVDPTVATFGKQPKTIYKKEFVEDPNTGQVTLEEFKLHRQDRVVACADCCLQIKPTVARETCPRCAGTKVVNRDGQVFGCRMCAVMKRGVLTPTGKVDGRVTSNTYHISREET